EHFQRGYFREQLMQLAGVNTGLEREQASEHRSEREMSLAQLQATIDTTRDEMHSLRREAARVGRAAIPMALGGAAGPGPGAAARMARGGPAGQGPDAEDRFPPPSAAYVMSTGDSPEAFSARVNIDEPGEGTTSDYVSERSAGELAAFQNRARTLQRRMNEYSVEWHKKWAIPFACIVFVLIGAPLAVRFPRGGAGMVILFSVIVFGIYYISLI